MTQFDLPLAELENYRANIRAPSDLHDFWSRTLADTREHDLDIRRSVVGNGLRLVRTHDLDFAGFGGSRARAWLHVPADATEAVPAVVQFPGYSGGRGYPHASLWAEAGYAHLVLDPRGQGWSSGGPGRSTRSALPDSERGAPGIMTLGIHDPESYYYRRLYTDALRLVEVARSLPLIDASRIIVTGISQGGGVAIAVAALAAWSGIPLIATAPDVPFLCDIERATTLTERAPYAEITRHLSVWRDDAAAASRTLPYFDGAVLASFATAPALFSVALRDGTCPPSTVFAAYNAYGSHAPSGPPPKRIVVYPHNDHEGGGGAQIDEQLRWFAERVGRDD